MMFKKLITRINFFYVLLISSPAFAADGGFSRANKVLDKVSVGLHSFAAATVTVAIIWIGYKVLWNGQSIRECGNIIVGAILIGGAVEIAALLVG